MPQRDTSPARRRLGRLIVFSLLAWALVALSRGPRTTRSEQASAVPADEPAPGRAARPATSRSPLRSPRRLAASFVFAILFFAGASFSAFAGDTAVGLLSDEPNAIANDLAAVDETTDTTDTSTTETTDTAEVADPAAAPTDPAEAPAEEPVAPAEPEAPVAEAPAPESDPAVAEEPEIAPSSEGTSGSGAALVDSDPAVEAAPVADDAPAAAAKSPKAAPAQARAPKRTVTRPSKVVRPRRVVDPRVKKTKAVDPEVGDPFVSGTVWLHRELPDPTPPSLRISRDYAKELRTLSKQAGADWALVLGVLRAQTNGQVVPAGPARISRIASRLAELKAGRNAWVGEKSPKAWTAALAITGRTAMSDRAVALAHYYRAIGLPSLVRGLESQKKRLGVKLLDDPRVDIYGLGRDDIANGRIDVRVLALIAYLAEWHGQITVGCLLSGHRLYARPGVISAHIYGLAVDISALGDTSILGNQEPGSVTEKAVREILLLPAEMRPRQVISLLGLGGPSFPLANHYDHIHVGY